MRLKLWLAALLASSLFISVRAESMVRERLLLDYDWKFHLGDEWSYGERLDKAGVSTGPAARDFGDGSWRKINLPHDWAIELPFDSKADDAHGYKMVGPGYHTNNIGWYRRTFKLPESDKGKRLWLEFDGVYRNCRVFLNGYRVGRHESGYSSFRIDITDVANCGGDNLLAVRVDASEFEGWFYEGAGIYRHAWLVKTAPLAVAPDGVFVYSTFPGNVPHGPATVHLETTLANTVSNETSAEVYWEIIDPRGKKVASASKTAKAHGHAVNMATNETTVHNPMLWSPETPSLYKLITAVRQNGKLVDRVETEFGIRTTAFDLSRGFILNGQPYVIKGTCNHQDHAGVGAAMPDALQYFRAQRLKDMGGNAVRTSHNPPTPEWLTACDHLGLLVMDENRLLGSDAGNLADLEGQIRRDRNHPSVFIWSLFNEEVQQATPTAGRIAATMQTLVHSLDSTRLCTAAANEGDVGEGVNSVLEVRGWNYHLEGIDSYHGKHPNQFNIGTEQASTVATRGIYANDKTAGYVSAYDENAPAWATNAQAWWTFFAARPWLSGGFVWTGFDYRGEPTPYHWPCINSHFGILDTCGFAKDDFYYYKAWWGNQPVLHLLPHWTWPGKEGQPIDVRCFANCEEVELFLNGESQGRKSVKHNSDLRWSVKYAPGTLLARGYSKGEPVLVDEVDTVGAPAALRLKPNTTQLNASAEDMAMVSVEVIDDHGRIVPTATNLVQFELTGAGRIAGVGNGDPSCHEPDVFIDAPKTQRMELNEWRMLKVPTSSRRRPELKEKFDDSSWATTDVNTTLGQLDPGEYAVFRSQFTATDNLLKADSATLQFAMIDDDGWIFVNGRQIGESHGWNIPASIEVGKALHSGTNSISVIVRNKANSGGILHGVVLEAQYAPEPVNWRRSVFDGLGQIILEAGREPGALHLTAKANGLKSATVDLPISDLLPRNF